MPFVHIEIDAKSQVLQFSIGARGLVVLVENVMVQCLRSTFVSDLGFRYV